MTDQRNHLEERVSELEELFCGLTKLFRRRRKRRRSYGRGRKAFESYLDKAKNEIAALGLAGEQVEILMRYGLLAVDNVTGFQEARSGHARFETLKAAVQHVIETQERAFYVEMDLKNLGGLNARLGHARTNEVFSKIAGLIQVFLKGAGQDSAFFRHGGDEMSTIVVASNRRRLETAIHKINQSVQELAEQYHLQDIENPKHLDDPRFFGIGVHFGVVEIQPEHASDPKAVFQEADVLLEQNKKVHYRTQARQGESDRVEGTPDE